MTREELITHIKFIVNVNTSQTDQDFSESELITALDFAIKREYNIAIQTGLKEYFKQVQDFTWVANDVIMEVPSTINSTNLIALRDVTDDTNADGYAISPAWQDRKNLKWGSVGPSSDRTIRAFYYARPVELKNDDSTPDLFPEEHHELLAWSTAVDLRRIGDELVPQAWDIHLQDLRITFLKQIASGRPREDVPRILPADGYLTRRLDTQSAALSQDGSSLDSF